MIYENLEKIVEEFKKTLLSVYFVIARIERDDSYSNAMNNASGDLARDFLELLSRMGRVDASHVAQYKDKLIYGIKNLINLMAISGSRIKDKKITLIAYRNLLSFENILFGFFKNIKQKEEFGDKKDFKPEKRQGNSNTPEYLLGETKKKIIGILKTAKEPVINSDIFEKLNMSKRNLKRNLKELLDAGLIERENAGKKVFYRLVL